MDRIRIGIVGCGEATQILHLPSLYQLGEQFQVTALCDASRSVVDQVGSDWNIPKRFTDERDLIAQDDVDAILIATPNHYHASITMQACEAGKHVMVEKPMCITLREADEVIAAQKRAGVVVQVAYMRRYAPAFIEACEMVRGLDSIKLARVHDVIGQNARIISTTSRVVRGNDIPAGVIESGKAKQDALFREAIGDAPPELGRTYGLLLGLASHDTSAMRELLGMPTAVLYAAQKHGGNYITAALDYGDFVCHLEIGVDGIPRYDTSLTVYGSSKVIHVRYDAPYVRNLPTRLIVTDTVDGSIAQSDTNPGWSDNFTLEWRAFYDHVANHTTPKSDPADFRHDLELYAEIMERIR